MFKGFFKKYGWLYLPGALFLVLASYLKTVIPELLGITIDKIDANLPASEVFRSATQMVVCALLVFLLVFTWRLFIIGCARLLEVHLRSVYFNKLFRLPLSFFRGVRSGDLITYAISDVNAVRMAAGPLLAMGLSGIVTGGAAIYRMIRLGNFSITFFSLLPIPFAVAAILFLGKLVRARSAKVQALASKTAGHVNESIGGLRVMKAFAKESEFTREFQKLSEESRTAQIKLSDTASLIGPVTTVLFGVSYAVALLLGIRLLKDGQMSIGDLVAYLGYLELVRQPVVSIGRIVNMLARAAASYRRLRSICDEREIPAFEYREDIPCPDFDIECKDLTFTYPGAKTPALQNVSFHIQKGQTVGICGPTGGGKSTLLALLLKLYEVERGQLFLDGVDIADIPAAVLRARIGYVPQDAFLFRGSIAENIAFYSGADTEKIEQAAKLSCLDGEIEGFPDGYESEVGERGSHLSGGQRQRTAAARALAKAPECLLLDDTLSALDGATARRMTKNLDGIFEGRTVLIVSHRLASVEHADKILWIDGGRLAESGTHAELLSRGSAYAHVYRLQTEKGGADA